MGHEAVSLLETHDFESLAERFGYALSFGQNPSVAIEKDYRTCLDEFRASPIESPKVPPSITVNYFPGADSPFVAVVECTFTAPEGCPIRAELIITSSGNDHFATLEQVSLATI